jgi:hypothetical protein
VFEEAAMSFAANATSTGLSCIADFANNGFSVSAQAKCSAGLTIFAYSVGTFSTSNEKEAAEELGDLEQAFSDVQSWSGWLESQLHKLVTAGGMG